MTTPRENLMKILRHEMPDWIPVTGHVDPYNRPSLEGMDPELAKVLANIQWGDESIVTFSRYLGLDIMDMCGVPVRITRRNVSVEQHVNGDSTTYVWHTPKGDLREVTQVCRDDTGAVSSNWTEHMVKSPEDIPAFAAIFEDALVEADPDGFEHIRSRRQLIGDDGVLIGSMDGTPLGMMYRVFSGVGTLAYLWADARDAMRDLFSAMETNYLQRMAVAIASDIDVLVGIDDTSTTAISPDMFETCNLHLTNERTRVAHSGGKYYFHHSCGHIRDLLPLYRQTNMDAVHAFTVPPVGNVTVAEGRRLLGDRITIHAGVDQLAGPMDDLDAVRGNIHQMIGEAEPWDHFTLGIAGYPNRTIEQTRFVVDCCREAGVKK